MDEVERLLGDWRLEYLARTTEFFQVRFKLMSMKLKEELSEEDKQYLLYVEEHIKNIFPHREKIIVNGEEQEVFFLTKLS